MVRVSSWYAIRVWLHCQRPSTPADSAGTAAAPALTFLEDEGRYERFFMKISLSVESCEVCSSAPIFIYDTFCLVENALEDGAQTQAQSRWGHGRPQGKPTSQLAQTHLSRVSGPPSSWEAVLARLNWVERGRATMTFWKIRLCP